ncbi:MAG TPA: GNAT family N-acetyltransferase [Gemmatimonadaceae bacterium]|nr:GNAT family N-acetyltransferase [Gemmatimonadaceae bacterium]
MPTLRTERLVLRPLVLADIEWYARFAGDADVMRFIGRAGPLTREQAEERLARYVRCWAEHELGMFSVRLRDDEQAPVGWGGLQPLDGTAEIEVGYAFEKPAWGRGFATELASVVVQWGFEERRLDRIVAVASAENAASRRVMDKLGMRYEGMRPVYGQDSVYYSLTPEAFARAASLRRLAL